MNLAIWDGVPFGLKWASYYLTGWDIYINNLPVVFGESTLTFVDSRFAQGSGPVFLVIRAFCYLIKIITNNEQTMVNEECAGDSLERLIILGSTNSIA
jgi:ACS family pantothenate transporter-like MFS transporter